MSTKYNDLFNRLEGHSKRHSGDRYKQLRADLQEVQAVITALEALDEPTQALTLPEPETELIEPVESVDFEPVKSVDFSNPPVFDYDDIQDHEEQPPEAYETTNNRKWWS